MLDDPLRPSVRLATVAKRLDMAAKTLVRRSRAGDFPAVWQLWPGGEWRVYQDDLEAHMRARLRAAVPVKDRPSPIRWPVAVQAARLRRPVVG